MPPPRWKTLLTWYFKSCRVICMDVPMDVPKNAYAVLLAGGGGTRLWPKSRKSHPKHLLQLLGPKTLLRQTFENFTGLFPKEKIIVITLKNHADLVKKELPELPADNFIIEPEGKNTALAMGVAAAFIHARDEDAVIINEAVDHVYQDLQKFYQTIIAALEVAARSKAVVAIGIKPTFPHTGLGYIRIGEQLKRVEVNGQDLFVFNVLGFKEKPDSATAQSFLATGQYLWNANLYSWSTKVILEAFQTYMPKMYAGLEKVIASCGHESWEKTLNEVYAESENIQIDYAISEKANNLVAIPGDFGWSDIGDWNVVYEILSKDNLGNALVDQEEHFLGLDNRDCLIETSGRLVVGIGLSNLVIIDTKDAILICPKDRTQDVKKMVEKLKEKKREEYL